MRQRRPAYSPDVTTASFAEAVASGSPVLGDGACGTRLEYETPFDMHADLHAGGALLKEDSRRALGAMHAGYAAIAAELGLAYAAMTPTFRATHERMERAGVDPLNENLNRRGVTLVRDACRYFDDLDLYIEGTIGTFGDNQDPREALDAGKAEEHHAVQAEELAGAGVDALLAATFPSVEEATGAARALTATGVPTVVSFMLDGDGDVLDGASLSHAVARVDAACTVLPLHYSIVCSHPSVARAALERATDTEPAVKVRVREIRANGSARKHDALESSDAVRADDPETWAEATAALRRDFGLVVLGGCCGTDDRHILALGVRLAAERTP